MRSILFLDVDGVLINRPWYLAGGERAKAAPECVHELNRIIDETGEASWRALPVEGTSPSAK